MSQTDINQIDILIGLHKSEIERLEVLKADFQAKLGQPVVEAAPVEDPVSEPEPEVAEPEVEEAPEEETPKEKATKKAPAKKSTKKA